MLLVFINLILIYLYLIVSVVGEFGRIAIEFLRKGSNPKVYEGAASK